MRRRRRTNALLEPLEDRFCMSAAAVETPQLTPVYARLSNGETVRLGDLQLFKSLDSAAASAEAAATGGASHSTQTWRATLTQQGYILLTPAPLNSRSAHSPGASDSDDALRQGRSSANQIDFEVTDDSAANNLVTQRSAALQALEDAPGGAFSSNDNDGDTLIASFIRAAAAKAASAGGALARQAEYGLTFANIRGNDTAASSSSSVALVDAVRSSVSWAANVLSSHVRLDARAARVAGEATATAAAAATTALSSEPQHYFGFSHLSLPYTLAADSIAAFAEESAFLSGAVGSRARSAIASAGRGGAWTFTLAVLAADLALITYIHRRTPRSKDAVVLPWLDPLEGTPAV